MQAVLGPDCFRNKLDKETADIVSACEQSNAAEQRAERTERAEQG